MALITSKSYSTTYFEMAGRGENLPSVIRAIGKAMKGREALQVLKVVFFTAYGEGPLLAINTLRNYHPKMIAVTFPSTFSILTGDEQRSPVVVPAQVIQFLRAFDVEIITSRLPFDTIEGCPAHNQTMETMIRSLSFICTSFPLCVQAVLQACDFGSIKEGEDVIGVTGDFAAIITACSTQKFLSLTSSFFVKEIICKPASRQLATKSNRTSDPKSEKPLLLTPSETQ